MLACYHETWGGPEKVLVGTIPKLSNPGSDQLLLKVHAASLNPADYKVRSGAQRFLLSFDNWPQVFGFDFSGEVVECGSAVETFKPGDLVFGMVRGLNRGSLAEYMIVDADICALKPANVSHEEAASIPLVGITALMALNSCRLSTEATAHEKRVLICGGSGGVGSIAIQLAKRYYSASFVATTASPGDKTALVKSLGADEVINYRKHKVQDAFAEQEHFDAIFDCVGDASASLAKLLRKDSNAGMCSIDAAPTNQGVQEWMKSSRGVPKFAAIRSFLFSSIGGKIMNFATGAWLIERQCQARNATYSSVIGTGDGELMQVLADLLEQGLIQAVIDSVYSLKDAKEALARVESGRAAGKVVVRIVE